MANNPLLKAQLNSGYQMDLSNFDPSAPSTEFSDILQDYDTDKLTAEYDMFFDEYDPSQERFAQRGLELQEQDLGAAFEQQQARFARESAALDFGEQQQIGEQQRAASAFDLQQRGLSLDEQQELAQQEFQRGQFGREQNVLDRTEGQAFDTGRMSLMNLYEQQQENMGGGFAGAGRRDARAQRAIDAQTGAFESQLLNLRDSQQDLSARRDLSEARFGISGERRDMQREALDLDRQADLARFAGRDFQREQQRGELSDQMRFAEGDVQRDLDRLALGFEQDVFGMRQRFASDTRRSLADLIESGADVDRFSRNFGDRSTGQGGEQFASMSIDNFINDPFVSGDTRFQTPYQMDRFGQTTAEQLSPDAIDYFQNREGYGETLTGQQFNRDLQYTPPESGSDFYYQATGRR